jgi:hypothetical protein
LFLTRGVTALLVIVLAAGSPAAAKCCSLGGGASYDFLGDSAMDIGMNNYDQFFSEEYPVPVATAADVKKAEKRRIRLNLNFAGPAEAVGQLIANKLYLDVAALGGEVYKFSLAAEGSSLLGDYSLAMPDGERRNATAEGKWDISNSY